MSLPHNTAPDDRPEKNRSSAFLRSQFGPPRSHFDVSLIINVVARMQSLPKGRQPRALQRFLGVPFARLRALAYNARRILEDANALPLTEEEKAQRREERLQDHYNEIKSNVLKNIRLHQDHNKSLRLIDGDALNSVPALLQLTRITHNRFSVSKSISLAVIVRLGVLYDYLESQVGREQFPNVLKAHGIAIGAATARRYMQVAELCNEFPSLLFYTGGYTKLLQCKSLIEFDLGEWLYSGESVRLRAELQQIRAEVRQSMPPSQPHDHPLDPMEVDSDNIHIELSDSDSRAY